MSREKQQYEAMEDSLLNDKPTKEFVIVEENITNGNKRVTYLRTPRLKGNKEEIGVSLLQMKDSLPDDHTEGLLFSTEPDAKKSNNQYFISKDTTVLDVPTYISRSRKNQQGKREEYQVEDGSRKAYIMKIERVITHPNGKTSFEEVTDLKEKLLAVQACPQAANLSQVKRSEIGKQNAKQQEADVARTAPTPPQTSQAADTKNYGVRCRDDNGRKVMEFVGLDAKGQFNGVVARQFELNTQQNQVFELKRQDGSSLQFKTNGEKIDSTEAIDSKGNPDYALPNIYNKEGIMNLEAVAINLAEIQSIKETNQSQAISQGRSGATNPSAGTGAQTPVNAPEQQATRALPQSEYPDNKAIQGSKVTVKVMKGESPEYQDHAKKALEDLVKTLNAGKNPPIYELKSDQREAFTAYSIKGPSNPELGLHLDSSGRSLLLNNIARGGDLTPHLDLEKLEQYTQKISGEITQSVTTPAQQSLDSPALTHITFYKYNDGLGTMAVSFSENNETGRPPPLSLGSKEAPKKVVLQREGKGPIEIKAEEDFIIISEYAKPNDSEPSRSTNHKLNATKEKGIALSSTVSLAETPFRDSIITWQNALEKIKSVSIPQSKDGSTQYQYAAFANGIKNTFYIEYNNKENKLQIRHDNNNSVYGTTGKTITLDLKENQGVVIENKMYTLVKSKDSACIVEIPLDQNGLAQTNAAKTYATNESIKLYEKSSSKDGVSIVDPELKRIQEGVRKEVNVKFGDNGKIQFETPKEDGKSEVPKSFLQRIFKGLSSPSKQNNAQTPPVTSATTTARVSLEQDGKAQGTQKTRKVQTQSAGSPPFTPSQVPNNGGHTTGGRGAGGGPT